MSKSVVIIGSGHAGVQAAASLREEGYDGSVVLVREDSGSPYHKPLLSKSFMNSATTGVQPLRGEKFYTDNCIDYRPERRAVRIDTRVGSVEFGTGRPIFFDTLIPPRAQEPGPSVSRELNSVAFSLCGRSPMPRGSGTKARKVVMSP